MSQDQVAKHRYEHEAQEKKLAREDAVEQREDSEQFLDGTAVVNVDENTGESVSETLGRDEKYVRASDDKNTYEMLPEFHHDDLERIWIIAPGTRLTTGEQIFDLRNPLEGVQTAAGYETVEEQLFVSKKETDYEMWNRLVETSK